MTQDELWAVLNEFFAPHGRGPLAREIVRLRRQVAAMREDMATLDWWENHLNIEHAREWEEESDDQTVRLFRRGGNRNDRVWEPVAKGPTLRAALKAVREATP